MTPLLQNASASIAALFIAVAALGALVTTPATQAAGLVLPILA